MIKIDAISDKQKDIYIYIYEWVFSFLFYNISLLLIGFFLHRFVYALLFSVSITLLRCTGGGTHAPSRILCTLISYFEFLFVIFTVSFIVTVPVETQIIIAISSIGIILALAPVDNSKKRFTSVQRKKLKIMSFFSSLILSVLIIIFLLNKPDCSLIVVLCVLISAIDLTIGYILNKKALKQFD